MCRSVCLLTLYVFVSMLCSLDITLSTSIVLQLYSGFKAHVVVCDNIFCHVNEVTLCRAQLVLGWVTVFGQVYYLGM